jgi:hypothetical protein
MEHLIKSCDIRWVLTGKESSVDDLLFSKHAIVKLQTCKGRMTTDTITAAAAADQSGDEGGRWR